MAMPAKVHPRTIHNWPFLRAAYCQGYDAPDGTHHKNPTLKDMSRDFNVSVNMLRDRSRKEKWSAHRRDFIESVVQEQTERRIETLGSAGAEFDSRCLVIANSLMDRCDQMLVDLYAKAKAKKNPTDVRPIDLVRVGQAYRLAQMMGKIALGEQGGSDSLVNPLLPPDEAHTTKASFVRVVYERTPIDVTPPQQLPAVANGQ